MLSLPIADKVKRLQGRDDVLGLDGSHLAHILDRYVASVLTQDFEQHLRPIAPEAQQSQIGQGLLWGANLKIVVCE